MPTRSPQFRTRCLVYAGLALVTLAVYLPARHHGFVEYDDQQYVTENPRVQAGLTWSGLVWTLGFHAGNWHPLAWLSHMLDCQLYGAYAGGHHLTSVLLHVGSTLLLFSVLQRMTNAMWRSAAVAGLFAWHPLHVESVAWVAERKDVLCAIFWMLTLWLYARYAAKPSIARYLFTLGSFLLCLMAKPMGVTLPFVLLLLDYWPLRRGAVGGGGSAGSGGCRGAGWSRLLLEKVPFLVLAAGGCVLTLVAQQPAMVSTRGLPVFQRFEHALVAYVHYLWALSVPRAMAVYYPYERGVPAAAVVLAGLALALITVLVLRFGSRRPYLVTGWLWFLGLMVPVIGLVQVGDQAWADRYTYLPSVGLFIAVVWGLGDWAAGPPSSSSVQIKPERAELCVPAEPGRTRRLVVCGLAAAVGMALLVGTSVQLRYWKDTRTLFEHANQVTRSNYLAITVLGSLLAKEHHYDQAMKYYQTALRYQPTFPEAHFFMGAALDEQGKLDEAIAEYQQALWFKPTQEQTHIFMGIALAKQKKYPEAIAHYNAALKLNPDGAVTHNNLARIFHTLGRLDTAAEHYHAALEIDPKLELAHNNLGILMIQKGDLVEGTRRLREALRLKPENPETQFNLALALNQQQQWSEAAELFKKAVAAHSADPKAHYEFAVALVRLKRTREAMSEYASALLIQPDFPDALDGLAWILSTEAQPEFRNGAEAVKMSERACELTGKQDPVKLKTLAAAYAETGRFAEAINTLRTAIDLAAKASRQELINECSLMLEHFQRSESWRL